MIAAERTINKAGRGRNGEVHPMVPKTAVIDEIKREAASVSTYTLSFAAEADRQAYQFQPGQFNMLYLPGIGEAAISVSSDAAQPEKLQHTIRQAGNVTTALAGLSVGDPVGIRGPYGSAWPMEAVTGKDLILVAGGIGLAPLRPAIYRIISQRHRFGQVTVLSGARSPADLLFTAEYASWRAHRIDVIDTVDKADKQWQGHVGVVPMMFYNLRPDPHRTAVFTCGPEIMMRFVIYEALARRIPKGLIYVSLERNMKCAIGFCGHCQFGPLFLCKDGPVLSFDQIEPIFGVEEF